jgi:hypothetical protein
MSSGVTDKINTSKEASERTSEAGNQTSLCCRNIQSSQQQEKKEKYLKLFDLGCNGEAVHLKQLPQYFRRKQSLQVSIQ